MPDGRVILVGDGLRDISMRMERGGLKWPWENPWEAIGDCRMGLSWPQVGGSGMAPGVVVLGILDPVAVMHVLACWEWRHVDTAVVSGVAGTAPVVVSGLATLVMDCVAVGVGRGCAEVTREDVARSYLIELGRLMPASHGVQWETVADMAAATARMGSCVETGRIIMPSALLANIKADSMMAHAGGMGAAAGKAIAALRFVFDESPHVPAQQDRRIRSMYHVV